MLHIKDKNNILEYEIAFGELAEARFLAIARDERLIGILRVGDGGRAKPAPPSPTLGLHCTVSSRTLVRDLY